MISFQVAEEAHKAQRLHRWPPLGAPGVAAQVAILIIWIANLVAVRIPGRIDGSGPDTRETPTDLLQPAGYAFSIWGVIYSWELVFMVWMLVSGLIWKESAQTIVKLMPGWVGGHAAQVMWCFTFTPAMDDRGLIWVSALFLALIAVGLSFAHKVVAELSSWADFFLMYCPITVHLGWVTAAALVNMNTWFSRLISGGALVFLMYLSLALAMVVVIPISINRKSALYAFVVGPWAACAVAYYTLTSVEMEQAYGFQMATVHGIIQVFVGITIFVASVVPRFVGQKQNAVDEEHGEALNS